jgi:hypothetical protein
MIDAEVGVYLGSSGSGEGHSLSDDELRFVYEVDIAVGRNPIAGYIASVDVLDRLCQAFPQVVVVNIVERTTSYVHRCRELLPERPGGDSPIRSPYLPAGGKAEAVARADAARVDVRAGEGLA